MTPYQRPRWALALRMPALETTLKEDHRPHEKRFIIEGQPVLKSLTWVTYGPVLAVFGVLVIGMAVWLLQIRSQPVAIKLIAVCAMVLLPMLCWVLGGIILDRLMRPYLEAEVEAGRECVEIALNLSDKTLRQNAREPVTFAAITGFKLVSDAGLHYDPEQAAGVMMNLVMETDQGQLILLDKTLGNIRQKLQLVSQLQAMVGVV